MKNRILDLMADKQKRDKKPITVPMVARAVGLTIPGFKKWVDNEIVSFRGNTVATLCEYFECDLDDLLYFDPPLKHQREPDAPQAEPER
ncbi:MAG TPA: helix-turn-helix transcriptional regulator [Candidatus Binatia bacterium]|nr:helix-turn-helix transcriptional regulator [Candidatus Binatia bacterium]